MNEADFKQAIIKHFGTMCEDNVDELLTRFSMTVAALKFAGWRYKDKPTTTWTDKTKPSTSWKFKDKP